jgi:hypothetical protein
MFDPVVFFVLFMFQSGRSQGFNLDSSSVVECGEIHGNSRHLLDSVARHAASLPSLAHLARTP